MGGRKKVGARVCWGRPPKQHDACVRRETTTASLVTENPHRLAPHRNQASKKIVKKKRTGLRQVFKCVQCNNDNVVECIMYVE